MNKNISSISNIFTIKNILHNAQEKLAQLNISEPQLDASILLAHVLSKPRIYLNTWPDKIINQGQVAMFDILLERRCKKEPIAYIIGQKEFFSLLLRVNEHTLIPRPETELLVEAVLNKYKHRKDEKLKILDLGTGSGAIAIALAKSCPNWQITAIDKSNEALEIAKYNAQLHKLSNIIFVQSDWFKALDCNIVDSKFDVIVSNPPYIDPNQADKYILNTDLQYEPRDALVADNKGLADIINIIESASDYLVNNGLVFIEHGFDQFDSINNYINHNKIKSIISSIESLKDYSGLQRTVILNYNV